MLTAWVWGARAGADVRFRFLECEPSGRSVPQGGGVQAGERPSPGGSVASSVVVARPAGQW